MTSVLSLRDARIALGGRPVLRGVTLDVGHGERVLVVGPSGEGKSTLLRAAIGSLALDSGSVTLFGADPRRLPLAERRRAQLLLQDPLATLHPDLPVNASLAETCRFFPTGRDPAIRGAEALRAVGLSDVGFRLPGTLSGGERRRASVARIRLASPALLLADEPTNGLDEPLQADVARVVCAAATSVLVVTHDAAPFLPFVDRVVVLGEGRVVETFAPTAGPSTSLGRALWEAA